MKKLPLEKCANGCDSPPSPPSLVICRECIDKITAKLRALAGLPEKDPERNADDGRWEAHHER